MRKDHFTEEALAAAKALAALKYSENPEDQLAFAEAYDFARCQRADGSFYGTGGQCRLGKETAPGSEEKPAAKKGSKPAPRISPGQASSALTKLSMSREGAKMKDSDFNPDVVGAARAAKNIAFANKAGKADPKETQKKVNKAIKIINERIKRLREAELNPEMGKNSKRIFRIQKRQQELKTMIKYLKSGNSALALQATREKSIR